MKVLVCGGRDYHDHKTIDAVLSHLHMYCRITSIVHGGASGADTMAGWWARKHNIRELPYPAQWELYQRRAGILRNIEMLRMEKPDFVIAFPGGAGTGHMKHIARKGGYPVHEVSN